MRGASRASYAGLRDQLGAVAVGPATSEQIGDRLWVSQRPKEILNPHAAKCGKEVPQIDPQHNPLADMWRDTDL